MKIVINATAAVAGGSITYLLNLLPPLAELDRENDYILLLPERIRDEIAFELPDNFRLRYISFARPQSLWRLVWEQTVLPLFLHWARMDLLYAPMDIAPIFAPCPVVLAVRNPNPYYEIVFSNNPKLKFVFQKLLTRLSARRARKVVFVSEYARDTIAPKLGVPKDNCAVVYHGLNHEMFDPDREFGDIPLEFREKIDELESYLLCVSTVYPHKNYDTLLRAWSLLPEDFRERNQLVVAGTLIDEKYADRLFRLAAELGITDQIDFLGRVPYRLVPYLYANASAFVFPSYLETFGHPLVEAMAMGVPIVASTGTCIPEIVCDAASLFDPQNPQELASKVEQVMGDQAWRRTLIDRGKRRASDFSWRIAAKKTLQIFKSIA